MRVAPLALRIGAPLLLMGLGCSGSAAHGSAGAGSSASPVAATTSGAATPATAGTSRGTSGSASATASSGASGVASTGLSGTSNASASGGTSSVAGTSSGTGNSGSGGPLSGAATSSSGSSGSTTSPTGTTSSSTSSAATTTNSTGSTATGTTTTATGTSSATTGSTGSAASTSSSSGSSTAGSTAGSGGGSGCLAGGFGAALELALPSGYTPESGGYVYPDPQDSNADCNGVNVPYYSLIDLTGDGLPDLVVSYVCNDSMTGNDYWLVYANTGTGFAATPTHFALPSGYTPEPGGYVFSDPQDSNADCNGVNVPYYSLIDLTGDGRPDLVVSFVCNDSMTGNAYWLVYANTGTGFAAAPSQWTLPAGYTPEPGGYVFSDPQDSNADCNGVNVPYYSVFDITGDGLPDLVVSYVCNDSMTGNDYWLVYANTGTGFAATPTQFALPSGYTPEPGGYVFSDPQESNADCNGVNVPYYSLIDLTGDGLPDLVVSYVCNDSMTGNDYWLVYANSGTGFAATPNQWTLPSGYTPEPGGYVFSDPQDSNADCNGVNVPYYSVFDITGDGLPDLVVSFVCSDSMTGNDYWLVYPNTGTGFAPAPFQYPLPQGYTPEPGGYVFSDPQDSNADCNGVDVPYYSLLPITQPGRLDLVVSFECNSTAVGNSYWLVYPGSCP